jgi:Glycosyl hydrolases family 16
MGATVIKWVIALTAVLMPVPGLALGTASYGGSSESTLNSSEWALKWSTDFSTPVKLGRFSGCSDNADSPDRYCSNLPASVRSQWWAYPPTWPDTATQQDYSVGGYYDPAHTVWISGGEMHIRIFRGTSSIHSAAVVPKAADGVEYGKFIETFSVSHADTGYKAAHLLWPTTGNHDYEVDFPEGNLNGSICAHSHSVHQAGQASFCPDANWTGWHTSEIEWAPGSVTFYLDGRVIGRLTGDWVPHEDMTWIIQNESALIGPSAAPGSWAQINIAYVAVYSYTG